MRTAAGEPTAGGADTATATDSYVVGLEVVTGGQRRHVTVVCDAESRGEAAQIARDVNEEEQHIYVKTLTRVAELQIVPPLAWDERVGLVRVPE